MESARIGEAMGKRSFTGTRFYDYDYSRTTFDDETIDRLCEAALLGANMSECALYAHVSRSALYRFLSDNPGLKDKLEHLRDDTALQARIKAREAILKGDEVMTRWYLERKRKDEFSLSQSIDINAAVGLTSIEDKKNALHDYLMQFKGAETDSKAD